MNGAAASCRGRRMVRRFARGAACCWMGWLCLPGAVGGIAQEAGGGVSAGDAAASVRTGAAHTQRARRFLAGRTRAGAGIANPRANPLNAAWQAVGPAQGASQSFDDVTGRLTSVAIDPADATGNTVYVGTTGGGVWKSVNAAGPAGSVTFAP